MAGLRRVPAHPRAHRAAHRRAVRRAPGAGAGARGSRRSGPGGWRRGRSGGHRRGTGQLRARASRCGGRTQAGDPGGEAAGRAAAAARTHPAGAAAGGAGTRRQRGVRCGRRKRQGRQCGVRPRFRRRRRLGSRHRSRLRCWPRHWWWHGKGLSADRHQPGHPAHSGAGKVRPYKLVAFFDVDSRGTPRSSRSPPRQRLQPKIGRCCPVVSARGARADSTPCATRRGSRRRRR